MADALSAAGVVTEAALEAVKPIWAHLLQMAESSKGLAEGYYTLDFAIHHLIAKRDDNENLIKRNVTTMVPSKAYKDWSFQVSELLAEFNIHKKKFANENSRPKLHIRKRSQYTNQSKNLTMKVIDLLSGEARLGPILVEKGPSSVVKMTTFDVSNIPTFRHLLEQILGWLHQRETRVVRIYGIPGTGKTTILQNLNNHDKVAELFDIIIWVTLPKEQSMENWGIKEIQQLIVQRLKLDIKENTHVDVMANRIKEELKRIKFLLLLDDLQKEVSMEKIGVPLSEDGSKVVFTSSSHSVCSSIATKTTKMGFLNRNEALTVFRNVLGSHPLVGNSNIKPIMSSIVIWCGYHPLLVKLAASLFRDRTSEQSWYDGMICMNTWLGKQNDISNKVYHLMKSLFDCLSKTEKKCLFYTALYSEDSCIYEDNLLYNWAAEKLLPTSEDAEEQHANGREILRELKCHSLLEEYEYQRSFKLHKFIRLAALHIMRTDKAEENLVISGKALEKPMNMDCWENKVWISLVDSKLSEILNKPRCPNLTTLFMQNNPRLKSVPHEFFNCMPDLRVLNLYGTGFKSLPRSVSSLIFLEALYLQNCSVLRELPSDIEKLVSLQVLDTRGSGLPSIPHQVIKLTSLRRLLVSLHLQNAGDDIDLICKMPNLKQLVIDADGQCQTTLYGLIAEKLGLTRFSLVQFCSHNMVVDFIKFMGGSWRICFPTQSVLSSCINQVGSLHSDKCQFYIGCDTSSSPRGMKFMPYFMFNGDLNRQTICEVLRHDVAIEFLNDNKLEALSNFDDEELNKIRFCVLEGCTKMTTLVDGNKKTRSSLRNLEKLRLINLPILKSIYEPQMQGFNNLRTLILYNCPMLVSICANGILLQLQGIQYLKVQRCSQLKEIFSGSSVVGSSMLPKLKKMILFDLPRLATIIKSDTLEWPSLEKLQILGCPRLKKLPFKKDSAVKLRFIEAERWWWETLENYPDLKDHFQCYCTFRE